MQQTILFLYLISSVMFILGLKMLTKVKTARRGNMLSSSAMLLAIIATIVGEMSPVPAVVGSSAAVPAIAWGYVIGGLLVGGLIGLIMAIKVEMTSMPEMVAIFNGFGGGASALVAGSIIWQGSFQLGTWDNSVSLILSILIGALTFTGSIVAFLKLKGLISGQPIVFPGNQFLNALLVLAAIGICVYMIVGGIPVDDVRMLALITIGISLLLGILLVIPIGGADMPVVISLLNSYSGLAAASAGFVLANNVLIITGALVGASGLILTQIMCKAMNRSLANVIFGGFGAEDDSAGGGGQKDDAYTNVKSCGPEEAAMIFESARDVIIVPGYGLAVAQAQHAVKELSDMLIKNGATVRYAIHPVAGRMPGHMNVLLAESNVPHEQLLDLDQINEDFKNADIALVVGANDVVNPAATTEKDSPIYGMPVLKVWEAKTSFVIKRSLGSGFAAITNDLFNRDNNLMLFGDAKKILSELITELKEL